MDFAPHGPFGRRPGRLHNVPAAAICDRNLEAQSVVPLCLALGFANLFDQFRFELLPGTDKPQPDIILMQLVDFPSQRFDEKPHQLADFLARPIPVLAAECEQGQVLTSRAAESSTVLRTDLTPARCPACRGNARCLAQRPLPSMMTAMCLGTTFLPGELAAEFVTQTSMSSLSFSASALSISAMYLSVITWISSSADARHPRRSFFP